MYFSVDCLVIHVKNAVVILSTRLRRSATADVVVDNDDAGVGDVRTSIPYQFLLVWQQNQNKQAERKMRNFELCN